MVNTELLRGTTMTAIGQGATIMHVEGCHSQMKKKKVSSTDGNKYCMVAWDLAQTLKQFFKLHGYGLVLVAR